ncbi:chitobiase/beta-hexosaminidase C-terminal domain-containing protein [bacterium]|nr:chitobiase/beta-hexosaminidase C-terminal domain-containing protein [bacterium]
MKATGHHQQTATVLFLIVAVFLTAFGLPRASLAQVPTDSSGTLYVVGTSHLDTQWRWTIQETINEYLPATLRENFALFDQFPDYTFSFEGSFRYRLMQEYYPADFERLQEYMKQDRWRVCGSWVDAVDVNIPSPESLIRHTLYGNGYFREQFNQSSVDIYLPDCFGFGYALPTIAKHSGLRGFSTQKLTWGSWVGTPFDIGRWRGVDGSEIIAAVNPDAYVSKLRVDLSADSTWRANVERQRDVSGLAVGYKYFGVGDTGGGPDSTSVAMLEQAINDPSGPLTVESVAADHLYRVMTDEQMAQLPLYDGELLMTRHGAGCYTSQSTMKRWNVQNEQLAQAAERAAVLAHLLGGYEYPRETLREAWERFLWHQFHDDLTGTSIPEAYQFSWNDELLSLNQFSEVLKDAVGSIIPALDTDVEGTPVVVYNPSNVGGVFCAEAMLTFDGPVPEHLIAVAPNGQSGPVQVLSRDGSKLHVAFDANVPSIGFAVYDLRAADTPLESKYGTIKPFAKPHELVGGDLRVEIDNHGDITNITYFPGSGGNELLRPVRYAIYEDSPNRWAAWEIDYDDLMTEPKGYLTGPADITVIENGPVRQAVEIVRHYGESEFRQIVRLSVNGLEVENVIDWREPASLLKVEFYPRATAEEVVYNLGVGEIKRGINTEKRYEVPAQNWAYMAREEYDSFFGLGVVSDSRFGWDHPDENTLRLTLLHTPDVNNNWRWIEDQRSQDIGVHHTGFKLVPYASTDLMVRASANYLQPLRTFVAGKTPGTLGREYSLLNPKREAKRFMPMKQRGLVTSVKLAEHSDEIIVRVQNQSDRAQRDLHLQFASPVVSAREVNGQEQEIGPAMVSNGQLAYDIGPYQPKAFALKLEPLDVNTTPLLSIPLPLPYNHDGVSFDSNRTDGDLDGRGYTIPGELWPESITREGIQFLTGPPDDGQMNLVRCEGQTIFIPGHHDGAQLVLLAASTNGHRTAEFRADTERLHRRINAIDGFVGQWNSRLIDGRFVENSDQILPTWIEREPVAWVGTHRHTPDGENEAYTFNYFYKVVLPLDGETETVKFPDDPNVIIAAASLVDNPRSVDPGLPLYDAASAVFPMIENTAFAFAEDMDVMLSCHWADAEILYTLDGSTPTEDSTPFTGSFTLDQTTTVKAIAVLEGYDSPVVTAEFERLVPRAAVPVDNPQPGLTCALYLGEWDALPDFSTLQPETTVTATDISVLPDAPDERFAQVYTGYLHIPETGLYTLGLTSDDGSRMYVYDDLLIENDGLHGSVEVTAAEMFEAGYHPIRIEFFQRLGGIALSAKIITPSGNSTPLEGGWLAR